MTSEFFNLRLTNKQAHDLLNFISECKCSMTFEFSKKEIKEKLLKLICQDLKND